MRVRIERAKAEYRKDAERIAGRVLEKTKEGRINK